MELRSRFGRLVAAHRRRLGLTQDQLAERAALSVDMISKIEVGSTGARFPAIERIANALEIDPAELFAVDALTKTLGKSEHVTLLTKLAQLPEHEVLWVLDLIEVALRPR